MPDNAVLDRDLPCSSCAYNLRGLTESHLCPECGSSIAHSVAVDARRRANRLNPVWLKLMLESVVWSVVAHALVLSLMVVPMYGLTRPIALGIACSWWVISIHAACKIARRDGTMEWNDRKMPLFPFRVLIAATVLYGCMPVIVIPPRLLSNERLASATVVAFAGWFAVTLYWAIFAEAARRLKAPRLRWCAHAWLIVSFLMFLLWMKRFDSPSSLANMITLPMIQFGSPSMTLDGSFNLLHRSWHRGSDVVKTCMLTAFILHLWFGVRLKQSLNRLTVIEATNP